MCFHKRLKDVRKKCGYTSKMMATKLGVAPSSYSQYENGVISLTAEVLIKLSDYYDVSIDFLLDRTDDPKRY